MLTSIAAQLEALASLLQETYHECSKLSNEQRYWAKKGRSQADKTRALVGNVLKAVARACT